MNADLGAAASGGGYISDESDFYGIAMPIQPERNLNLTDP
jgi:hypothetical protein